MKKFFKYYLKKYQNKFEVNLKGLLWFLIGMGFNYYFSIPAFWSWDEFFKLFSR